MHFDAFGAFWPDSLVHFGSGIQGNHCSECLQLIGLKKWLGQLGTQALILVKHVSGCACILSQPNNSQNPNKSQNPNNKTTKTVVGLRQTSRWEPPPPPTYHLPPTTGTQNYMIEQKRAKLRKQKLLVYIRRPQNSF